MDLSQRTEAFAVDDTSWLGSRHGVGTCVSVTLDTSAFTQGTHYPNGFFRSGLALAKITATGKYGPYGGTTDEVQTVTVTGAPTGGTFTLTYAGQTTSAIAFDATAAAVQAALIALSNIGASDVTVTGAAGGVWSVAFVGDLADTNVAAMTASGAGLTGGTTPGITIGTSTAGGAEGGSGGTETLSGFLMFAVPAPTDTTVDIPAAMLDHGKIVNSKLPVPVDANGRTEVAGRIIFV